MNTVSFDMSELFVVGASLGVASDEIEREIQATLADVMDDAEIRARSGMRIDTGDNRSKTRGTVQRVPGGAIGRLGSSAKHAYVMELGRRPGGRMPPQGVLLGWMRRHGIPESAEYPIRRKIARRGIPADHNLRDTMRRSLPQIERELTAIGPRVIRRAIRNATR